MSSDGVVRFGVLGAARIAPPALILPARKSSEAEVAAVAARDPQRAETFAAKHEIRRAYASYDDLLADPDIDAVYNPLPNSLHAPWTLAALEAGKHVLCEKPFTANAAEAATVAKAAAASGRVVMEAFHYRYHPVARRMAEIVHSGELGALRHVEVFVCFPLPKFSDIRYRFDLAGGAMMDAGCYAVHMARLLGGSEPKVVSAAAKLRNPQIDRAMTAQLKFAEGHTGKITASMWSAALLKISARVIGEHGELRVLNPLLPQMWHRIGVRASGSHRVERLSRRPTYSYQMDTFCGAVLRGEQVLTAPQDAVANMTVIDAVYTAAGLSPRGMK